MVTIAACSLLFAMAFKIRGGFRNFLTGGIDSSDEGPKTRFSDYHKPDWKVCFLRAEDIFPRQICALGKTTPHTASPYEMTHFSSTFFKFCALDWLLRAWQFVCAPKIFSMHNIPSSLDHKWQKFLKRVDFTFRKG